MIVLTYLTAFLLFCILQSLFIAGVHGAAYGETKKLPDGSDLDSEMILYPLYKWLHRQIELHIVYSGDGFAEEYEIWKKKYSSIFPKHRKLSNGIIFLPSDDGEGESKSQLQNVNRFLKILNDERRIVSFVDVDGGNLVVQFAEAHNRYIVSKWLRKPTLGCPKCMPSLWSLVTYWPWMLLYFGVDNLALVFGLWIPSIAICSYLSYFFVKKNS